MKHAFVTGGGGDIGAAIGARALAAGYQVVLLDQDGARAQQRAAALKGAIGLPCDVTDEASVEAALDRAAEAFGGAPDLVVNCAGMAKFAAVADVDEALWDATFNANVKGAFFQIQALLPILNAGTSIVLNGSINARIGMPNSSVYAASKAALISLAKTLSGELLSSGIRVNVVSPGPVSTPIYGKLGLDADTLAATAAQIQSQIPLGRFGQPAEIAATVLHLSAPESAFIVGTEIIADGGMSQL